MGCCKNQILQFNCCLFFFFWGFFFSNAKHRTGVGGVEKANPDLTYLRRHCAASLADLEQDNSDINKSVYLSARDDLRAYLAAARNERIADRLRSLDLLDRASWTAIRLQQRKPTAPPWSIQTTSETGERRDATTEASQAQAFLSHFSRHDVRPSRLRFARYTPAHPSLKPKFAGHCRKGQKARLQDPTGFSLSNSNISVRVASASSSP